MDSYNFLTKIYIMILLSIVIICLQLKPLEGVVFADCGTDLGSASAVPGMPFFFNGLK